MPLKEINLAELAQGAVNEQFQKNFQSVIDNIYDPNTPAKATRKLTIEMIFKPDEDREMAKISSKTKLLLAPSQPVETKVILDYDVKTKQVLATEWGNQIKGQLSLDEDEDEVPNSPAGLRKI